MNDELSKKLIEWVENTANLASEQVPGFIEEIARYGVFSHLIDGISGMIALFFCVYITRMLWKKTEEEDLHIITCGILAILTGIIFFGTISCFQNAAMACFAPKLYAIKQIQPSK